MALLCRLSGTLAIHAVPSRLLPAGGAGSLVWQGPGASLSCKATRDPSPVWVMVMGARVAPTGLTEAEVQGLSLSVAQGSRRPGSGRVPCSPVWLPRWQSLPGEGTCSAVALPRDKSKVPARGWAPPPPLPLSPWCTGGEGSSKGPRDPPNSGAAVRALTRPRPHAGSATLAQVSRDLYLLYRSHRRRRTQEFHFLSLV